MFIEALSYGGERSGLPRKKVLLYAAKAAEGGRIPHSRESTRAS